MGNAATCGNAAESPNHRGSIKGPSLVEWHLEMLSRGLFRDRASPNPTSGLPFPFRITSMSFTGWHGVFVSFVILNDVTQPPQTHTPDHKVYFGLKVVYFCSMPESFTPSIRPVLFCGALCQDPIWGAPYLVCDCRAAGGASEASGAHAAGIEGGASEASARSPRSGHGARIPWQTKRQGAK